MTYFSKNNRKKVKQQAATPVRMKIILGIIFILFATLVGQLAYLQLGYGSRFKAEVQKSNSAVVSSQVPRGVMYDAKGRVLVGNRATNAITYTKNASTTASQIYQVANKLSNYIKITDEKLTQQQAEDYYLGNEDNSKAEQAKLPKSVTSSHDNDLVDKYIRANLANKKFHYTPKQKRRL